MVQYVWTYLAIEFDSVDKVLFMHWNWLKYLKWLFVWVCYAIVRRKTITSFSYTLWVWGLNRSQSTTVHNSKRNVTEPPVLSFLQYSLIHHQDKWNAIELHYWSKLYGMCTYLIGQHSALFIYLTLWFNIFKIREDSTLLREMCVQRLQGTTVWGMKKKKMSVSKERTTRCNINNNN